MTNRERIEALERIISSYAPSGDAKDMVKRKVKCLVNEEDDHIVVGRLCASLYDGLAFGNWWWVLDARLKEAKGV